MVLVLLAACGGDDRREKGRRDDDHDDDVHVLGAATARRSAPARGVQRRPTRPTSSIADDRARVDELRRRSGRAIAALKAMEAGRELRDPRRRDAAARADRGSCSPRSPPSATTSLKLPAADRDQFQDDAGAAGVATRSAPTAPRSASRRAASRLDPSRACTTAQGSERGSRDRDRQVRASGLRVRRHRDRARAGAPATPRTSTSPGSSTRSSFELPLMAAAMDGVVSPATAIEVGRLGGLGCLNLEGLWTRYDDLEPVFERDRDARAREGDAAHAGDLRRSRSRRS